MRTLICIPTYNEATNIVETLQRVRAAVPDADILVLDDNSPDGTAAIAEKAAAEYGRIDVLIRPGKAGLGAAYRAGFGIGLLRGYDHIVQMDADLSHEPEALPALLAAAADGADLVVGSRYVPGGSTPNWPPRRRALSRWGSRYARLMLRVRLNDITAGFRVWSAAILHRIAFTQTSADGYGLQVETTYKVSQVGGSVVELPITFHDRVRGTSKMSWRIIAEAMSLVTWWGIRDRILRRLPK